MATKQKAREFLHKVATDAGYRAQVEKDPAHHLAQHGFNIKPGDVPAEGIKLPSSERILAHIEPLSEKMESTAGEIFFAV